MPRRRAATLHFNAIQLVGGLLPASLIEQIARQDATRMTAQDYGLPKGMRLQVPLDQAWIRAKVLWEEAKELRSRGVDSAIGVHFSQRLLKEVFGWGDLQACDPRQIGEASYPINFRAFGGTVPLVLTSLPTEELDKGYKQFGQDSRRRSPHSCLQECLNADDDANWGVLCNGDTIRLLHDNPALVKPAYVAIALDQLFDGGLFDEFTVLWLLLHASRFQRDGEGQCVLDGWKAKGQQTGERALNKLRDGVQLALENLANGLLQHRANHALIAQLESSELSTQAFFEELLRLVYRLLFLCVAEDRGLLFGEGTDPHLLAIYRQGYSLSRLRDLAIRRSAYEGQHGDLWKVQRLVFAELDRGDSPLGLPGLGGLFAREKCSHLDGSEIANGFLLEAVKAIGWFFEEQSQSRTRINYRDLNTEEFGSVYESLLELHPQINRSGGIWRLVLGGGAGSDRKTSGSYYTPDGLVQELIKSALLPVIRERLNNANTAEEKEAALLAIRVLDPACGSGHFLLAAARRLALELARIRAGDDQPSEELRQQCMREVVAKCIYGVDRNPMAAELCKVALWLEAIEPGKPLGFLDAHIQCGDSLVGVFDPKLLEQGISDGAYKPLTGDDKRVCTSLKKANQEFVKRGQADLFSTLSRVRTPISRAAIEALPESTLAEVEAKEAAFDAWHDDSAVSQEHMAGHTYTAAFFLPKTADTQTQVPTSQNLDRLLKGQAIPELMEVAVRQAAKDYRFLHWFLAFPEAMAAGGFDCVLGNPPWERIKLQEKEFFASRSEGIARAPNKAARERLILELGSPNASEADQALVHAFKIAKREAEGSAEFIRGSGRFSLTAVGDLNTYALFAELFLSLIAPDGRAGLIVPTGIATDSSTKVYFDAISSGGRLVSLYDFENREDFFPAVDSRMKFALLTLGKGVEKTDFVFFATAVSHLSDHQRHFSLSADDIALINPNTRTCPVFRSMIDADLTRQIYSRVPILVREVPRGQVNPWGIRFTTMFHMTNDSSLMSIKPQEAYELVWEAKMTSLWDHRDSDIVMNYENVTRQAQMEQISESDHRDFARLPKGQFWTDPAYAEARIPDSWPFSWIFTFKRVTAATNWRTLVPCVIPRGPASYTLYCVYFSEEHIRSGRAAFAMGALGSMVVDYCVRHKTGQPSLPIWCPEQVPIHAPSEISETDIDFVLPRLTELVVTSNNINEFASDLGLRGRAPSWDPHRRAVAQAELDAYYAYKYGLARNDLAFILDPTVIMGEGFPSETFRVLKDKEIREFGEYRTSRLVLDAWERLFA